MIFLSDNIDPSIMHVISQNLAPQNPQPDPTSHAAQSRPTPHVAPTLQQPPPTSSPILASPTSRGPVPASTTLLS